MLMLPCTFTGFSSRSDGSASLRWVTQELTAEDFALLKEVHNQYGWLVFRENEIKAEDIPHELAEDKNKTPSKRLRATLFVLYKQLAIREEFDIWYRIQMEKIIDQIKSRLD